MKNRIRRLFYAAMFRIGFVPVKLDIEGKVYAAQYLSTEEQQIIQQFQAYVQAGMQKGGTVGGCGGCPSAGECGSEPV